MVEYGKLSQEEFERRCEDEKDEEVYCHEYFELA